MTVMNMVDIILKKRNGGKLTDDEIAYFIKGYTDGSIPDYQVASLLMAIYFRGMDREETLTLTREMRDSGDIVDLSDIPGIKVDKHSTGGVGDKTTLIVGPIAAAAGVPVAKMSGRGLGFTGGTVDKLEAIPGYRTSLEPEEFKQQVRDIGISVIAQTGLIAPADKKIYALRDVTGTVENKSLIASSIMSKKLASGANKIVLDVKCGNGAFFRTHEDAAEIARMMVDIGNGAGHRTAVLITDMNQPLGKAIGNALEVQEAIDVLKGIGPADITTLSIEVASVMIYFGEIEDSLEKARALAWKVLNEGKALAVLEEMIRRQGGDASVINDPLLMGVPKHNVQVIAKKSGYVTAIDTAKMGTASRHAGAGRFSKIDVIDMTAGILINKKIGDRVEEGQVLMTIFGKDFQKLDTAIKLASEAYTIEDEYVEPPKLIKEIIL